MTELFSGCTDVEREDIPNTLGVTVVLTQSPCAFPSCALRTYSGQGDDRIINKTRAVAMCSNTTCSTRMLLTPLSKNPVRKSVFHPIAYSHSEYFKVHFLGTEL